MKSKKTLSNLQVEAKELVKRLDWQSYHTPENLLLFLFSEVSELGEYCTWTRIDDLKQSPMYGMVKEEVADVFKGIIFVLNSIQYKTPIETLIRHKIELDEKEYPKKLYDGKHRYEVKIDTRTYGDSLQNLKSITTDFKAIKEIQADVWEFSQQRDWVKFYTPASLVLALAVKVGQVAVAYQKRQKPKENMEEYAVFAMTSAIITLLRFCTLVGIEDVYDITLAKIQKDEGRFKK